MAEVIPTNGSSDGNSTKKEGKFLAAEDTIIVREVGALRAHMASYGTVKQTFENVDVKVNQNPHMTQKVTWTSAQDRYKRLQEEFDCADLRNSGLSGIAGGESRPSQMGELYQALSQMREERDSFTDKKQAAKSEKARKEEEKELLSKKVVEMALLRKSQRSSDEESDDGEGGSHFHHCDERDGNMSGRKRKSKRPKVERIDLTSGLAWFADKLKEADMAWVNLDVDALEFEKHKHEMDLTEREKDRCERRKEREKGNKLELEKFKLMMDVFKNQKQ